MLFVFKKDKKDSWKTIIEYQKLPQTRVLSEMDREGETIIRCKFKKMIKTIEIYKFIKTNDQRDQGEIQFDQV